MERNITHIALFAAAMQRGHATAAKTRWAGGAKVALVSSGASAQSRMAEIRRP